MIILGEITMFNIVTMLLAAAALGVSLSTYLRQTSAKAAIYLRIIWDEELLSSARIDEVTHTEEFVNVNATTSIGIEIVNKSIFPIAVDRIIMFKGSSSAHEGIDVWRNSKESCSVPYPLPPTVGDRTVTAHGSIILPLHNAFHGSPLEGATGIAIRFSNGASEKRYFSEDELSLISKRFFSTDD